MEAISSQGSIQSRQRTVVTYCTRRGFTCCKKDSFNREDNQLLEKFPQGHDGTSVTGVFWDMFGHGAR